MKRLNRPCWWCGGFLLASTHAEVETPNGKVWVHLCCEKIAKLELTPITAQLGDHTPNLAQMAEREQD